MPEVQEVFRLATNKVAPEPEALERQLHRQRSAARTSRVRAYIAVAAVMLLVVVGAIAILKVVDGDERIPADNGSGAPEQLTFRQALPAGAVPQTLEIVGLDGRSTRTIDGFPLDGYAPGLSADGSAIAFVVEPAGYGYNQIGVMYAGGNAARFVPTPGIIVGSVAISPDATRIAFEGIADANTDIYVVKVGGSGLQRLTDDPATDQYPQWSPDGSTIVYDNAGSQEQTDPQFSTTAEIWTMPADGNDAPTRLTVDRLDDNAPAFSPDGERIAYFHGGELWTMAADGGDASALVSGDPTTTFTPRWSPDGQRVAFTYYREGNRPMVQLGTDFRDMPLVILAVVDVDTGRVSKLTNVGMATDLNTPQWVDNTHILVSRVPVRDTSP